MGLGSEYRMERLSRVIYVLHTCLEPFVLVPKLKLRLWLMGFRLRV